MDETDPTPVEVVYALPERQWIVTVEFEQGLTAMEAVARSKLSELHPEIEDEPLVLGVFGIEVEHDRPLKPGDRVEICRPLKEDPREMRRQLIEAGRVMGQSEED